MPHKFFFVYEIKGDINKLALPHEKGLYNPISTEIEGTKFKLNLKKPVKIESMIDHYFFKNQEEINGEIQINDKSRLIPFKLRSKSRLLFLETPYPREKLKIVNFFDHKFDNLRLESFVPTNEEEVNFICKTAKLSSFKVFIDDEIVRSDETEEDLCKGLMENMELIEVTLDIKIKDENVTFYYYGNAIQFPHQKHEENIEGVIQAFENTMMAPAK